MIVSVLIPFSATSVWRGQALGPVCCLYEQAGYEVVTGSCEGPWSKGLAVQDAARRSSGAVLIVADADCLIEPAALDDALRAVATGAPWAVPFHTVRRLTQEATTALYRGKRMEAYEERPYPGRIGGGIVVLPRALWEQVPIDPRFVGWGQEDEAWGYALTALAGDPIRLSADLLHLWHPAPPRMSRRYGSRENQALYRRYLRARYEPERMEALVAEAREAMLAHAGI